jgi:hypothetical protein
MHYSYFTNTKELNPRRRNAPTHEFSILKRRIFIQASSRLAGNNVNLKANIIHLVRKLSDFVRCNSTVNDDTIKSGCDQGV